ncbi:CAF17-like 4Fe-4S cluster assembly/insertion protein YgfZ [Xanthomonas sp. 60]
MPDNLYPDFVSYAQLADRQLVSLSGADAVTFAHAQFSADVVALGDGHWQWSAWLSAKGRTLAVFQLIRMSSQHLLLLFADGDANEIASQLQRFVFRRKVSITVRTDLRAIGGFCAPARARGAVMAGTLPADGDDAAFLELDIGSGALPRTLRIAAAGDPGGAAGDAAFTTAWRASDLRFGLPRLVQGQREQWTPQQLGLDRLNGYSVKKGCYPGQEIVARTHFLGKAKRGVQLLELDRPCEAGASVEQAGAPLGTVVSTAGTLALAVLPLETSEAPVSVDGQDARRVPLLDGLGR